MRGKVPRGEVADPWLICELAAGSAEVFGALGKEEGRGGHAFRGELAIDQVWLLMLAKAFPMILRDPTLYYLWSVRALSYDGAMLTVQNLRHFPVGHALSLIHI